MSRVQLVSVEHESEARATLQRIQQTFGMVPAMFCATANSLPTLNHLWGGFVALAGGKLSPKLKEQIAIAIADLNRCEYCLAAHTALGRRAGATDAELAEAQAGRSADPQTDAALSFAVKVVELRAQVRDEDVALLRRAGFDDEALVEILAHVALNLFTNYVNVALRVPVDFPEVRLRNAT